VKNSLNDNDFVLGLEENAMDSLVHGVEHYIGFIDEHNPTDLKYAILHVFHALELFLKARLAKAHPLLIYQKPEDGGIADNKANTVDFKSLIGRLRNVSVDLSRQNLVDLDSLHTIRNSIEHHRVEGSSQVIEDYVGKAMRFLKNFLQKELGIILRERLDKDAYNTLSNVLDSYNERLERAKQELPDLQDKDGVPLYSLAICEECLEETIVIPDPTSHDDTVHCFFCDAHFYVTVCERCGSFILSSAPSQRDVEEPELCSDCWDEMRQRIADD